MVVGLNILTARGKRRKIKARCELCQYSEIGKEDRLVCVNDKVSNFGRLDVGVKENGYCELFDISQQMLEDVWNECI